MNKHVQTLTHETDSDHDMVVTTLKVKGCVRNVETMVKRNFSRFNLEEYKTELLGMKWSDVYDIKDPTLIDSFITDTILEVLNEHAPVQNTNQEVASIMRVRNYLENVWRE